MSSEGIIVNPELSCLLLDSPDWLEGFRPPSIVEVIRRRHNLPIIA